MKKILPYIIALIAIIVATFFALQKTKKIGSFPTEANIIVKDSNDIQKIFLVDMNGKSVTLQNKKTYWTLNDSFKAREDAITNLVETINRQVISNSVPTTAKEIVLKDLSTAGIKVEVYNGYNKKVSCFYVGGETKDGFGTYMLKDGTDQPYIYEIPGFQGALSSRYFTNVQDWRAREAINIADDDLQKIEIKYAQYSDSSFSIIKQGNSYSLKSIYTYEPKLAKIKNFIKKFNPMYCAGFDNGNPDKDSIIKNAPPFGNITVTHLSGKSETLNLYYHELTQRTKSGKEFNGFKYDPDFMYANNSKDFMLLAVSNYEHIFCSPVSFY